MQRLCLANGVYALTARQVAAPFRPGLFQVTDAGGCEAFAAADGFALGGSSVEAVRCVDFVLVLCFGKWPA